MGSDTDHTKPTSGGTSSPDDPGGAEGQVADGGRTGNENPPVGSAGHGGAAEGPNDGDAAGGAAGAENAQTSFDAGGVVMGVPCGGMTCPAGWGCVSSSFRWPPCRGIDCGPYQDQCRTNLDCTDAVCGATGNECGDMFLGCIAPCTSDDACGSDRVCGPGGTCLHSLDDLCSGDADCLEDMHCEPELGTASGCVPNLCETDADCGGLCLNGRCNRAQCVGPQPPCFAP